MSQNPNSVKSQSNIENIYLNLVINHNGPGYVPTPAVYNSVQTNPIVDKASDWYISIIRFDIPLSIIPLYIFPIVPASTSLNPQPNPNLSPMVIGFTVLGLDYERNLIYVSDNPAYPAPVQNIVNQQVITVYYFVYSYDNLINSLNVATNAAWVAAGSPGGGISPFFYFNPNTGLISFVVSDAFITSGAIMYCNTYLLNFIDSFNFNHVSLTANHEYNFVLDTNPQRGWPTVSTPITAPQTYYQFIQNYSSLAYWTALRKILFISNSLPIVNEYEPSSSIQQNVSTSLPIITDFVPAIEFASQSRSIAYYYPTSQYRLVNLIGDIPIQKLDMKIYWQDKFNNIYQLYLPYGNEINIKLAFIKKSLYNPMNQLLLK